MTTPRTYTHTWVQARLESIQDQFRFLLMYADVGESHVDKVADGVAEEAIESVGVYACDATGLRVIEVELKVDWSDHARLTLETPFIVSGLPGWKDHETPEMRVAGRRFAETVKEQELTTGWWIRLSRRIRQDGRRNEHWRSRLNMSGKNAPDWKGGGFDERTENLFDLEEGDIFIRRNRE